MSEEQGAPYGIIDPDYARIYTVVRCLAWQEGYAAMMHGSFTRDLDIIIVPWAEHACEPEHVIKRIEVSSLNLKLKAGFTKKPHGRLAWTFHLPEFGDPRFVDISVFPPSAPKT